MIDDKDIKKYSATYSVERLKSFIYSDDDTIKDIMKHYSDNMLISQALYPALSTLEVFLRNTIDTALRVHISETWIEDEIKNNSFLEKSDYQLLLNAYNVTQKDCLSSGKKITTGKIIANLNFGFWTNLCVKKYSPKIWNKMSCFKGVFVNYPNHKPEISVISQKLYSIRKLRNRIFHYEQIFKNPAKTLELYNLIIEVINYLPNDEFCILEKTSTFFNVYNQLTIANKQKT